MAANFPTVLISAALDRCSAVKIVLHKRRQALILGQS
jgi:hypothetical protein